MLYRKHIDAIEFKNMLSDEGDTLRAVLQITAAGGTESCDWAENAHAYVYDVGRNRLQKKRTEFPKGESAGIKR
jgi:peptide chain release factor 2